MSRYGWSSIGSPYGPSFGGGVPSITDDDFSYITSEDLQEGSGRNARYQEGTGRQMKYYSRQQAPVPAPEDDLLIIKNKGATYPAHFPAYSIGDGKLRVSDIRNRIAVELDISDRRARRAKILYKGRQLKEPAAPVRDYGVKNNSEIMVVVPDAGVGESSSASDEEEEMVVVDDAGAPGSDEAKKRRKKRSKKSKKSAREDDSASNVSSSVPGGAGSDAASSAAISAQLAKLKEIDDDFMRTLHPMALDFIANTPTDPKKCEDEHRKISETTMQNVLLKLDAVEPNGDPDTRMRRKELVRKVQHMLKELDDAKARV